MVDCFASNVRIWLHTACFVVDGLVWVWVCVCGCACVGVGAGAGAGVGVGAGAGAGAGVGAGAVDSSGLNTRWFQNQLRTFWMH